MIIHGYNEWHHNKFSEIVIRCSPGNFLEIGGYWLAQPDRIYARRARTSSQTTGLTAHQFMAISGWDTIPHVLWWTMANSVRHTVLLLARRGCSNRVVPSQRS